MNKLLGIVKSDLDGKPVAIIAKPSGNKKVKGKTAGVIACAVIPMATVNAILDDVQDRPDATPIQRAKVYMESMKSGAIDSACHDDCEHKRTRKCFAQFNAQNVSEPVAMTISVASQINAWRVSNNPMGLFVDVAAWADALGFGAGDRFRLMVVGSTGALPVDVSTAIVDGLKRAKMTTLAYVENWRSRPDLRGSHMASCYTMDDVKEAQSMGWRPFYSPAAETLGNTVPKGLSMCPGSKYRSNMGPARVGCADCGLCDGARDNGSTQGIVNIRHGNGDASRVAGLVRKGILGRMIVNHNGREIGAYAAA